MRWSIRCLILRLTLAFQWFHYLVFSVIYYLFEIVGTSVVWFSCNWIFMRLLSQTSHNAKKCPPFTITLLASSAFNQIFRLPTTYRTAFTFTSLLKKVILLTVYKTKVSWFKFFRLHNEIDNFVILFCHWDLEWRRRRH